MGSGEDGPRGCTCWEPVYDLEQQPLQLDTAATTRARCCADCAFRNGSPERVEADGDFPHTTGRQPFWCHQGVRRVVGWRHPDGREMPAGEGDYRPPFGADAAGDQAVWLAVGRAGERCAGWAALVGVPATKAASV